MSNGEKQAHPSHTQRETSQSVEQKLAKQVDGINLAICVTIDLNLFVYI